MVSAPGVIGEHRHDDVIARALFAFDRFRPPRVRADRPRCRLDGGCGGVAGSGAGRGGGFGADYRRDRPDGHRAVGRHDPRRASEQPERLQRFRPARGANGHRLGGYSRQRAPGIGAGPHDAPALGRGARGDSGRGTCPAQRIRHRQDDQYRAQKRFRRPRGRRRRGPARPEGHGLTQRERPLGRRAGTRTHDGRRRTFRA